MRRQGLFVLLLGLLLFGCGESEQAKRAKVANWVNQLTADPSLATKEEFTKPLGDYADLAAPEFAKLLGEKEKQVQIAALKILANLKRLSVVDAIVTTSKSPDPEVRVEVAKTLAAFASPLTIKPLIEMTKDEDINVRAAALEGLGTRADRDAPPYLREVLPYLVGALDDPNPQIRQAAVKGLVNLGQWALQAAARAREQGSSIARQEAEKVFQQICDGFRKDLRENTDRLVRRDMARYLGELRYKKATLDLVEKLKDPDPEVRIACAYALGNIGARHTMGILRDVLDDTGEEMPVRLAAAVALGQMGDQQAVRFLIYQLTSTDEKVRTPAVEALRAIGKPAAKLLEEAAKDKDPLRRWGAVAALGETGDPKVAPVLLKALQDESSDIRAVASSALGKLRYAGAIPKLVQALGDKSEQVQAHAEWALEQIGNPAIPALLDGAKKANLRFRVFRLLGRLKERRALPILRDGLKDKKAQVRAIAAWTLGEIGDPDAVSPLQAAFDDKDASVRREVALALGKLKIQQARTILLRRLAIDTHESVRSSCVLALNQLSPEPKTMEGWLQEAAQLPDTSVRAAAERRLKELREVL